MKRVWVVFFFLLFPAALWAQQYTISTIVGGGPPGWPLITAIAKDIPVDPTNLATDAAGNVYFSAAFGEDYDAPLASLVFRLSPNGVMTPVAGTGSPGYSGDGGPATSAQLNGVCSLAVDSGGNLYIADCDNQRIRMVSPNGTITTIAGNGTAGYSGDGGPAVSAQLGLVIGLAVDAADNLYLADWGNQRVRKVSPSGIITTIAGNGIPGSSGDGGPATSAQVSGPGPIAIDGAGNLYIAELGPSYRVRKISSSGIITTFAGNGTPGHSGDGGPATAAQLNVPKAVAVDGAGNVYIADGAALIRKVYVDGIITTIAGNGTPGYSGDGGPATSAQIDVWGIAADSAGDLYFTDASHRVREVSQKGIITTVAGNGLDAGCFSSGDGGPASQAHLCPWGVNGLTEDAVGNLFISDFSAGLLKVSGNGIIARYGGLAATAAQLGEIWDLAVDAAGNLYIAAPYTYRIWRLSPEGVITAVAGNGTEGYSGDGGPATAAQLDRPLGVAVDGAGNVYIADYYNSRIRKVTPDGVINTIASQLNTPIGLAADATGNLYFSEFLGHTVRRISSSGDITTIAGNGSQGFSGDGGAAINAQLAQPAGLALDSRGNLYIADLLNNRVRKVSPSGTITTIAGSGEPGCSGDAGPATNAQLSFPFRLAVDAAGNVYLRCGDAVRLLEPDGPPPTIAAIANTASTLSVTVAPGEVVDLYHSGIGPAELTRFTVNDAGLVGTQFDRTQVTFNGIKAPLV